MKQTHASNIGMLYHRFMLPVYASALHCSGDDVLWHETVNKFSWQPVLVLSMRHVSSCHELAYQ